MLCVYYQDENHKLSRELRDSVDQTAELMEKLIRSEMMRDQFSQKLDDLKTKTGLVIISSYRSLRQRCGQLYPQMSRRPRQGQLYHYPHMSRKPRQGQLSGL